MFDPTDLLGGLLQAGLRGPSMGRLEHAMGERGLGAPGGPLGQILGRLGAPQGGGTAYPQPGAYPGTGGGGILDGLAGMAGGYPGGGYAGGGGSPLGGGLLQAGLGALATAILSGRGRAGGMGGMAPGVGGGVLGGGMRGAVGAGGLALLAMLAMRALRNSGQQRPQALGFAGTGGDGGGAAVADAPPEEAVSERTALLVLRAMVAAAKADGRVDEAERRRIAAKVEEGGADPEALAFLQQEMAQPSDPYAIAVEARDPVVAAQVYAASLLAVEVDSEAERAYLRDLAGRLGLDAGTVTELYQALCAPAP